jgi:hypothetical protein
LRHRRLTSWKWTTHDPGVDLKANRVEQTRTALSGQPRVGGSAPPADHCRKIDGKVSALCLRPDRSGMVGRHRAASPQLNETGGEECRGPGNLRWQKLVCFAGGSTSNDVCPAVQAGPCNVNTNIEVSPFWGSSWVGNRSTNPKRRRCGFSRSGSSRSGPALIAALRRTTPKPRALRSTP